LQLRIIQTFEHGEMGLRQDESPEGTTEGGAGEMRRSREVAGPNASARVDNWGLAAHRPRTGEVSNDRH
jgi:hypothetical protein